MRWMNPISRRSNLPRDARTAQRGFSLLEILIGLGIVIAVAAIAVPWTMGWLGTRELDNAEDGLTMQMMMARAAAREEGRPVEVVAEYDGKASRVNARWMLSGEDSAPTRTGRGRANGGTADEIDASWASMQLPRGVRIALGLESAEQSDADLAPVSRVAPARDEPEAQADVPAGQQTLAIFLPDGTVFFAPVFMLRTDAGTLRTMKVDRSTGVPHQVAQEEPSSDDEFARSASDEFEDEFSPTDTPSLDDAD